LLPVYVSAIDILNRHHGIDMGEDTIYRLFFFGEGGDEDFGGGVVAEFFDRFESSSADSSEEAGF
jgi:hypothetical protein